MAASLAELDAAHKEERRLLAARQATARSASEQRLTFQCTREAEQAERDRDTEAALIAADAAQVIFSMIQTAKLRNTDSSYVECVKQIC